VQLPCDSAETQVWEQILHIRAMVDELLRAGAPRQAAAYARISQLLALAEALLEGMAARPAPLPEQSSDTLPVSSA